MNITYFQVMGKPCHGYDSRLCN